MQTPVLTTQSVGGLCWRAMQGPTQPQPQPQSKPSRCGCDDPLLSDFPDATPEQRTILMLMSRVGAIESELQDARSRLERAERTALAMSSSSFGVGKRVFWQVICDAGIHPVPGRTFVALTDLASDLIDRALRRGRGPLFEQLKEHSDGTGLPTRGALTKYVGASGLASGLDPIASVQFVNIDAGMLMVHITGDCSMLDVMAALHRLLEEDDSLDSREDIYVRHQLHFVFVTRAVADLVNHLRGSTRSPPVLPGGMEAAVSAYISTHQELADDDKRALENIYWRSLDSKERGGTTLTRASRMARASRPS